MSIVHRGYSERHFSRSGKRPDFHKLLDRAGVRRVRFHDLRHTAATLMLEADVHPKVVQEVLGHSSISVTLDTYSHVAPSLQRDAATRLEVLLG
jgi:integrase